MTTKRADQLRYGDRIAAGTVTSAAPSVLEHGRTMIATTTDGRTTGRTYANAERVATQ